MNSLIHSIKVTHAGDLYEFDLQGREIIHVTIHPNMQSYFATLITLDQTPDAVLTKFYAKLSNHHAPRNDRDVRCHPSDVNNLT